jgi:hypothetical protein
MYLSFCCIRSSMEKQSDVCMQARYRIDPRTRTRARPAHVFAHATLYSRTLACGTRARSCRADAPTRLRIVVVDRATRRSRSADGSDLSEGRPLANHTHQPLAYSEQVRSPFIGPTVGPSSGLNFLASGFSLLGLKPGPVQVLPRGLQPLRPMHDQTDPANNKSNRSVVKSSQTNNQVKRTAQPGDGSHGHAAPDEHLRIAGLTSAAHSEQLLHMVRYEHEST